MLACFYIIYSALKSIKKSICESIEDIKDREHRKIDNVAYVGNGGLRDYNTGHILQFVNQHAYKDTKTGEYIKKGLSVSDIELEQRNKEQAIQRYSNVYVCSDYYLPINVVGTIYKAIDTNRVYLKRHILSRNSSIDKINGNYYISLNSDTYGQIELGVLGKPLKPNEEKLRSLKIDITHSQGWNNEFSWKE